MSLEDELRTRMQQLLLTAPTPQNLPRGGRDASAAYTQLLQIAATVFLLDPTALPHTVYSACSRLRSLLDDLQTKLADIESTLSVLWVRDLPVEDLSSLDAAARGLRALSSASTLGQHTGYKTFQSAVDSFLAEQRLNLVQGGQLRTSSAAARESLDALISEADALFDEVLSALKVLKEIPAAHASLDLGRVAASNAIQETSLNLSKWLLLLDDSSPGGRALHLRELALDLISSKTVLSQLAQAPAASLFYTGAALLSATSGKTATPPTIQGSVAGPFGVTDTISLTVTVGENPPAMVTVPESNYPTLTTGSHNIDGVAILESANTGPFYIHPGQVLQFFLYDGVAGIYVGVEVSPAFGTYTTTALCTEISNAIAAAGLSSDYSVANAAGSVRITANYVEGKVAVGAGDVYDLLGYETASGWWLHGDKYMFLSSRTAGPYDTSTDNTLRLVFYDIEASVEATVAVTLTASASLAATAAAADIQAAIVAAGLDATYTAVGSSGCLYITASETAAYVRCASGTALSTFGWSSGRVSRGAASNKKLYLTVPGNPNTPYQLNFTDGYYTADTLVQALQAETSTFDGDFSFSALGTAKDRYVRITYKGQNNGPSGEVATLGMDASESACAETLRWYQSMSVTGNKTAARSVAAALQTALDSWIVTVYREFQPNRDSLLVVPSLAFAGRVALLRFEKSSATATSTGGVSGTLEGLPHGVVAGDSVVFATGLNTGTSWTVVSVDDAGVVAITGSVPLADGAGDVYVGPTLTTNGKQVLEIYDGPNRGVYDVSSVGSDPSTLQLAQPLPTPGINGAPATGYGGYGSDYLRIYLKDRSQGGYLRIQGGADLLGSSDVVARSKYLWFTLDEQVRGLKVGDILDVRLSDPYVTTARLRIEELSGKDLRLSEGLEDLTEIPLRSTSAPTGYLIDALYEAVQSLMQGVATWESAASSLAASYVRERTRLRNLVMSTNPSTRASINDLGTWLELRSADMAALQDVLLAFPVVTSERMRSLVTALRVRGADRAVDLLQTGDLAKFFGTSSKNASYGASVRSSLEEAAYLTNPSTKNNPQATKSVVNHTIQGSDPEYDLSDTDDSSTPTVPGNFFGGNA